LTTQAISKQLTTKDKVGGLVALIGASLGGISFILFLARYQPLIMGNKGAKNMAGATMLTGLYPAMNDIAMASGVAFLVACFGFFTKKRWAWTMAIIAATCGLLSSWLGMVWPLMIQQPVTYLAIFIPEFLIWLTLVLYVRRTDTKLVIVSVIAGIAFVLNFMNGTAALNKMIGMKAPLFLGTQQLNWLSAIAFGIFTVAILYRKDWAVPIGLGGSVMGLIAGIPLAYLNTMQTKEFSLFWIGVIVSAFMLIALLIHGQKLVESHRDMENYDISGKGVRVS